MLKTTPMITLNLIPKKLKQEIEFRKLLTLVNRAIISIIVLFIFYFLAFGTGKYILTEHYEITKKSYALLDSTDKPQTPNIDSINEEINFINDIQTDTVNWSMLIYNIGLINTTGIDINNLSLNKEKKSINIRGEAKDRQSLLNFKGALEREPYLSEIILPLESLFNKENLSFAISATIKSYELEIK